MHVSRICSDLVRIKSENPPGRTDEVIEYIRDFLAGIGIRSAVCGNGQGMENLVAHPGGARLMLCGHVDVVPALADGWTRPPFSGTIEDGHVWGRGSTDMKGGAPRSCPPAKPSRTTMMRFPATLAFVCDEETGGENGIRYLLANNRIPPVRLHHRRTDPCTATPASGRKGSAGSPWNSPVSLPTARSIPQSA